MSITCFKCKQPIEGDVINACGKNYHPGHFRCRGCNDLLQKDDFVEIRKQPYCQGCATAMGVTQAGICAQCGQEIRGKVIKAVGNQFHPECFCCSLCAQPFNNQSYYKKDGKFYCKSCFTSQEGLVCHTCKHEITGKFKQFDKYKYHEGCFVCSICGDKLEKGAYCRDGLLFCSEHRIRKIGYACAFCGKFIDSEDETMVIAMDRKFHADHFICCTCNTKLYESTARVYLDKVYCPVCYEAAVQKRYGTK